MKNERFEIKNNIAKQFHPFAFLLFTFAFMALTACSGFADGYLSDPMSIGVGARPLGMGKAYVAVAEDGDAIFMNPAGLARSGNPKLTSMYASLMGDVNYEVIGGVYPLGEKAAVGAGYIGASVDSIPLTDSTGAALGTGRWSDSVFFLSYATYLSEIGPKFDQDVLVGANLKYFGSSGNGVSADSGSGYGLDLGLLIPVNPRFMLGADFQNALSSKITNSAGSADTIQRTLKVGAKIKLLGSDDTGPLAADDSRKLYCALDYDYNYNAAGAAHLGAEFWPTANLALRAGLDDKDPTAGLGVRVSGLSSLFGH